MWPRELECTTCMGPIVRMNITWRGQTLYSVWCLECHKAPEILRPLVLKYSMRFFKPGAQATINFGPPAYDGIKCKSSRLQRTLPPVKAQNLRE